MNRFIKILILPLFIILLSNPDNILSQNNLDRVILGSESLLADHYNLISGKKIGLICNHTAMLPEGTHLADKLNSYSNVKLAALFGPEHGIRGDAPDGEVIDNSIDKKTGVPIFSLYGKNKAPTRKMLENIDLLLFDIQDVGARYYTFISTLYYSLKSAAENNIKLIVLDRPNPINGLTVDGPITESNYKSFVAIAPIPIIHGMTIGELALLFNDLIDEEFRIKADLKVIKMKNWKRSMYFDETGLKWINPSPNIRSLDAALLYSGLCLLEGTNLSEGRGTYSPFTITGAPFIHSEKLIRKLKTKIEGISILDTSFTPISIKNLSKYPKYANTECFGFSIKINDRSKFNSLKFAIELISATHKLFRKNFKFKKNKWVDKLYGSPTLRTQINNDRSYLQISSEWQEELTKFKKLRKKYLLY